MKSILLIVSFCIFSTNLFAQFHMPGTFGTFDPKLIEEAEKKYEETEKLEAEGDCNVYIDQYHAWIRSGNKIIDGMAVMAVLTLVINPIAGLAHLFFGISENQDAKRQAERFHKKYINCLIEKKERLTKEELELAQKQKDEIDKQEKELEEALNDIKAFKQFNPLRFP